MIDITTYCWLPAIWVDDGWCISRTTNYFVERTNCFPHLPTMWHPLGLRIPRNRQQRFGFRPGSSLVPWAHRVLDGQLLGIPWVRRNRLLDFFGPWMPWSMWQAIHDGSLPAALQPSLRWGLRWRDGEEDHIQIRFLPLITVAQYHMNQSCLGSILISGPLDDGHWSFSTNESRGIKEKGVLLAA